MLLKFIATVLVTVAFVLSSGHTQAKNVESYQTVHYGAEALWVMAQPASVGPKMPPEIVIAAAQPQIWESYEQNWWMPLVEAYGDWDWATMNYIIKAESKGDPTRVSDTNDWGLCQVNWPSHWDKVEKRFGVADPYLLLDPVKNMAICHDIYEASGGYTPWTTYHG